MVYSPLNHVHKRKKSKTDPYPHPHPWVNRLDKIVLLVGVLGPVMTIPQVHKIFAYQNAAGLSLITWVLYVVFNIPWIIYGIVHKEKPIIVAYCLWFITNLAVVIGILMYG